MIELRTRSSLAIRTMMVPVKNIVGSRHLRRCLAGDHDVATRVQDVAPSTRERARLEGRLNLFSGPDARHLKKETSYSI